jgi:hypothetical protein
MGVFGPKYPPRLQEVVSHAERFCQQLSRLDSSGRFEPCAASQAWLAGRLEEIEVVLGLTLSDWTRQRVSVERAARSMTAYLLELHTAACGALGVDDDLDCCSDEAFLTEVVGGDSVTRLLVRRAAPSPSTQDTWFDPGGVLLEVQAAGGRAVSKGSGLGALVGSELRWTGGGSCDS